MQQCIANKSRYVMPGLIYLEVNSTTQELYIKKDELILKTYKISTAKNGLGEDNGSYKTPRGWHAIRAKIGAGCAHNTVFVGRRATGELYTSELNAKFPGRDWILTRILWLSGLEPGFNRLGNVDTMRRYVYIHGSPDDKTMGEPGSRGCIRMYNKDIVELFDLIEHNTRVYIGV